MSAACVTSAYEASAAAAALASELGLMAVQPKAQGSARYVQLTSLLHGGSGLAYLTVISHGLLRPAPPPA